MGGKWSALAALVLAWVPLRAQQVAFSTGLLGQFGSPARTYTWQAEYLQRLDADHGVAFSWMNEGHLPGHHRDGYVLQLGRRWAMADRPLLATVGIGPYRFFDTVESPGTYRNHHGWGFLVSAGLIWMPSGTPWFGRLRVQRVIANGSPDTHALLVGAGYRLLPDGLPVSRRPRNLPPMDELTLSLGKTIVNSQRSELATGWSLEYRHGLRTHVDLTVSLLNEGDPGVIRRNGMALQVWAKRRFLERRLELGFGLGPYYHLDLKRDTVPGEPQRRAFAGIVTPSVAWCFRPDLLLRFNWNRVRTGYSRDTDLMTLGLGRRW